MNTPKRIAYIFEEAKIFLTKDGRYYGFSEVNGKVKCRKLSKEEKDAFLREVRPHSQKQDEEVCWQPIARMERPFDTALVWSRFGRGDKRRFAGRP